METFWYRLTQVVLLNEHSFIHSVIHSLIHSFIHSFIHMLFPREVGFERLGRCMFLGNPVRHTPAPPPKMGALLPMPTWYDKQPPSCACWSDTIL